MTTTATPPGATAPTQNADNPLVVDGGNTVAVLAALNYLSMTLKHFGQYEGNSLNNVEAWGLACLLEVCVSALETMSRERGEA